jgi:hypothetical protein
MATIAIAKGDVLKGAFLNNGGTIEINGPGKFEPSLYVDDGTSVINADVIGSGKFYGSKITFGGSVDQRVTVDLDPPDSTLIINKPTVFKATVGLVEMLQLYNGPTGTLIQLVGINANGCSFEDDILTMTYQGNALATLSLANSLNSGFTVAEVQGNVDVAYGEFSGIALGGTVLLQQP